LATATHPVDPTTPVRTTRLPSALGDIKQGAGLLNVNALLAFGSATASFPGATGTSIGYYANSYNFSTDFTSGYSNDKFNITIPSNAPSGSRLRVVIAWDSTATGSNGGGCMTGAQPADCTVDTLNGDLDLDLFTSTGTLVTSSSTYDSSWEMVDVAVSAGNQFYAQMQKWVTNEPSTYLGIAWQTYNPANE
jgi:hypothetical protein